MSQNRFTAGISLSLLLAACSSGPEDVSQLNKPPRWTVEELPQFTIGEEGAGSEYQFSRLTAVRRLPDGGVVLANAGSAEVRAFAPDGTFRWSVGQPGDGPGDFRSLARVEVLAGDTILALDYQGPRLTWIGPDGIISRTIQVLDPAQCGPPASVAAHQTLSSSTALDPEPALRGSTASRVQSSCLILLSGTRFVLRLLMAPNWPMALAGDGGHRRLASSRRSPRGIR